MYEHDLVCGWTAVAIGVALVCAINQGPGSRQPVARELSRGQTQQPAVVISLKGPPRLRSTDQGELFFMSVRNVSSHEIAFCKHGSYERIRVYDSTGKVIGNPQRIPPDAK